MPWIACNIFVYFSKMYTQKNCGKWMVCNSHTGMFVHTHMHLHFCEISFCVFWIFYGIIDWIWIKNKKIVIISMRGWIILWCNGMWLVYGMRFWFEKNQFNWKFSIKQNQKGFKCAHIVFCVWMSAWWIKEFNYFLKLFDVFRVSVCGWIHSFIKIM